MQSNSEIELNRAWNRYRFERLAPSDVLFYLPGDEQSAWHKRMDTARDALENFQTTTPKGLALKLRCLLFEMMAEEGSGEAELLRDAPITPDAYQDHREKMVARMILDLEGREP